jgi:hypothetical protein
MCADYCRHCRLKDGNHFWTSHTAPQQPQAIKCQIPTLHHCANIDFSLCQPLLQTGGREELYWAQPLDGSSYCNMEGWYIEPKWMKWTKQVEELSRAVFFPFSWLCSGQTSWHLDGAQSQVRFQQFEVFADFNSLRLLLMLLHQQTVSIGLLIWPTLSCCSALRLHSPLYGFVRVDAEKMEKCINQIGHRFKLQQIWIRRGHSPRSEVIGRLVHTRNCLRVVVNRLDFI